MNKTKIEGHEKEFDLRIEDIDNEHDFNNFRIELVKNVFVHEIINDIIPKFISNIQNKMIEDGNMSSFPRGLYDHVQVALSELYTLRK